MERGAVYGRSLYELCAEEGKDEAVMEELRTLNALFREAPDYAALLDAPTLPKQERLELLDAAFSAQVDGYVLNTMKLLVQNRLIRAFSAVVRAYEKAYFAAHNMERAVAVSAVPLLEEQRARLIAAMEQRTGKTILLETQVDPSILGGVIVRTETMQLDGSVKFRLDTMKSQILAE